MLELVWDIRFDELDVGIGVGTKGGGRPNFEELVNAGADDVAVTAVCDVWIELVWSSFFWSNCNCLVRSLMLAAVFFLIELFSSTMSSSFVVSSSIWAFFCNNSSATFWFWVLFSSNSALIKVTCFLNETNKSACFYKLLTQHRHVTEITFLLPVFLKRLTRSLECWLFSSRFVLVPAFHSN